MFKDYPLDGNQTQPIRQKKFTAKSKQECIRINSGQDIAQNETSYQNEASTIAHSTLGRIYKPRLQPRSLP